MPQFPHDTPAGPRTAASRRVWRPAGVLAPHARSRGRVVASGRVPTEKSDAGPVGAGVGSEEAAPARSVRSWAWAALLRRAFNLDLAPLSPLWQPHAPDRHRPRSSRHSADPRSPGPRVLGAEPRPRPARVQRRALSPLARGGRQPSCRAPGPRAGRSVRCWSVCRLPLVRLPLDGAVVRG